MAQSQYIYTSSDISRFWEKVNKQGILIREDLGLCWPWTASPDGQGYGKFWIRERGLVGAHIVSYELTNGPVPDGFYVCHRCDYHPCARPDHLFAATPAGNTADMMAKGRHRHGVGPIPAISGDAHWTRQHPERRLTGERHPGAKLTAEQIDEIRKRYAAGGISQRALAREYDIVQQHVSDIVRGEKWQ